MNIPLPPNGHWVRVRFGKKVKRIPLQNVKGEEPVITLKPRISEDSKDDSPRKTRDKLVTEIMISLKEHFVVPEKLIKPDELIIAAQRSFKERSHYLDRGLQSTGSDCLAIEASPAVIPRALRFMDTFIKIMQVRGYVIYIENRETKFKMGDHVFSIKLKEKVSQTRQPNKSGYSFFDTIYTPTGILSFKNVGYGGKVWTDTKEPLESKLAQIIAWFEIEKVRKDEQAIRWKIEHDIREEKERQNRLLQERKEKELTDFKSLLADAARWEKLIQLRAFIAAKGAAFTQSGDLSPEQIIWLNWAKAKMDWYDPSILADDEFLVDVNRDTLVMRTKSFWDR